MMLMFIVGLDRVIREASGAKPFSYLLAGAGLLATVLHTGFIIAGHPQFRIPTSTILLPAILLVSIAQLVVTKRTNLTDGMNQGANTA